jgi:hypothetical protein
LEVVEYAVGGRCGLIIVPEWREGWGWKILTVELGKVVTVFDSPLVVPPKLHSRDFGFSLSKSMGKDRVVEPRILLSTSYSGGKSVTILAEMGPSWKNGNRCLRRWFARQSLGLDV